MNIELCVEYFLKDNPNLGEWRNSIMKPWMLSDNSDGKGAYISKWDEAQLGRQPTLEELKAIEVDAIQAQAQADATVQIAAEKISPASLEKRITDLETRVAQLEKP